MTPATLTQDLLADIEAKARAATPGPRRIDEDTNEQPNLYVGEGNDVWIALFPHSCLLSHLERARLEAAYIAAVSPEVVLALIEAARERDRLRAELAELRATLAAERGEPEGVLPGWRAIDERDSYARQVGLGEALTVRAYAMAGTPVPIQWGWVHWRRSGRIAEGVAKTAREAMRAADATLASKTTAPTSGEKGGDHD